jgi:3-hydroxyisobutyrate dehydrogenase-like beta-hydroxyacid dehydrogenase
MSEEAQERWLIVGHGSVGSELARRLRDTGIVPHIFDPLPRVPIRMAERIERLDASVASFDGIVSCVSPPAALDVVSTVAPVVLPGTMLLDWNTVLPSVKQEVADRSAASVIDVALLDTLDQGSRRPSLAVSGRRAMDAVAVLVLLGFQVEVVGEHCGDAARLKLARSLFMKTLEALIVEFEAAVAVLPGRAVVMASIEGNLGSTFTDFARLLLRTDQLHAARRYAELEGAVSVFREAGRPVDLADAAVGVLRAAAAAWAEPDAPVTGAPLEMLAGFLGERLHADR